MDNNSEGAIDSVEGKPCRRKRSNLYRRPQNDSHSPPDVYASSSMSSMLPSTSQRKGSSGDNFDAISGVAYSNLNETEYYQNAGGKNTHQFHSISDVYPSIGTKDNLATATVSNLETFGRIGSDFQSGQSGALSHGVESQVKKVKLKVGGVTRTIHTSSGSGHLLAKSSSSSSVAHQHQKDSSDKGNVLQGVPWKDFSKNGFIFGRSSSSGDSPLKQTAKYNPAHTSKHFSKTSKSGEFNTEYDDDDDAEIRFLEKLKTSKFATSRGGAYDEDEGGIKKLRKISRVLNQTGNIYDVKSWDYNPIKTSQESIKFKSVGEFGDNDYVKEDEESLSDHELRPKMKQCKDLGRISGSARNEMAMTTRKRAQQTGKEVSSISSIGAVEFSQGLPPHPKKQKEKLSEVEQQLKKAEAAQRRRMQAEKAAQESEAEAIRKILGQDSSRKKREDKLKKKQESAQERKTKAAAHPSNAIRWILGPSGTVVTFPSEMGLPSIFEPKACRYRDSKSRLPLCSLQCYKEIHKKVELLGAC
ncbi:unnamed protein product [Cuscuta epithymum]|uniref:INO80 complex subunit B-like conserved region domain-containing protein n=1 Tax=Cuscuta epithymum TaxID=186058 RepID=A0AAV0C9Q8_9ASTE|nr:unnamed protein product [Cuscuta epithymum]CAH9122153.1 unnamed protein product [Cuscuta epithymum]